MDAPEVHDEIIERNNLESLGVWEVPKATWQLRFQIQLMMPARIVSENELKIIFIYKSRDNLFSTIP